MAHTRFCVCVCFSQISTLLVGLTLDFLENGFSLCYIVVVMRVEHTAGC